MENALLRFRSAQEWRAWCVKCRRRRSAPLSRRCERCEARRLERNRRDRLEYTRRRELAGTAPRVKRSPDYWREYHRRYRLEHLERRRAQQRAWWHRRRVLPA